MGRGKPGTYRAQVEESMLPGQPVSLLWPRRDEHGPGVGVNTLGQHLLGQENKGNQQSPEQEQRAGPQIHQSIGVPLPAAQGSRQRQVRRPPVSVPRGPALPRQPLLSPTHHGDGAAGVERPRQQHNLQGDGEQSEPAGTRPPRPWATLGAPLAAGDAAPCWPQGCPRGSAADSPSAELLFTSPIAQCVLMLCACKHGRQTWRGAGRGRRRGNGGRASRCWGCCRQEPPLQPRGVGLGTEL